MSPSSSAPHSLNRRGFLKISAACALAAGLSLPLMRQLTALGEFATLHETRFMIGTVLHLNLIAPDFETGRTVAQAVFAEIERLADIFDHRRAGTPLARLNAAGTLENAPAEFIQVLRQACHYGAVSQGAFDISIKPVLDAAAANQPITPELLNRVDFRQIEITPEHIWLRRPGMSLTLDGIAKGWIMDAAVGILRAHGYENALVEAGGDLMAAGLNGSAQPWKVGILHPRTFGKAQTIASLPVSKAGLATSGDYRNAFNADFSQNHIIDPRTGRSPLELSSATVLAPTCADADALSTALMVLGPRRGLELIEQLPDCAAMTVGKDLNIQKTPNFPAG